MCLHLSVCIRVSVHRCNAYVMSSTLVTAYRSLISLAMPSRCQSLSLSPSWVSNCKLDHLQNARIALGTSHIREIPQMLSCYAFTLTLQLQLAAAAAAVATMREPTATRQLKLFHCCVLTTKASASLVLRTLTSMPSLWLPVYCVIITSLKITGFRLRTQQANAK